MAVGKITCVVNRTERNLSYTKNGVGSTLFPGENHIPAADVRFALTQNVLMGSENPLNPMSFISLVGVKGHQKYLCGPITFAIENKKPVAMFEDAKGQIQMVVIKPERFNRELLPARFRNAVEVEADVVLSRYNLGPMANDDTPGSPVDSAFVADA